MNTFRSSSNAIIIITHYRRLLEYIRPDFVHIMKDGQIIQSGGEELSVKLEAEGYAGFKDVPQPAVTENGSQIFRRDHRIVSVSQPG